MKIMIISGTPKKEGLSFSVVNSASEAAGKNSAVISLGDIRIQGCKVCNDGWGTCRSESHECCIKDDGFEALRADMHNYDAYVFITPVYWGETSELMKSFLDRIRRCEALKGDSSVLKDKKCIIVVCPGGSGGGMLTAMAQIERAIIHMKGLVFDYIGINRWNKAYKIESLKSAITSLNQL